MFWWGLVWDFGLGEESVLCFFFLIFFFRWQAIFVGWMEVGFVGCLFVFLLCCFV